MRPSLPRAVRNLRRFADSGEGRVSNRAPSTRRRLAVVLVGVIVATLAATSGVAATPIRSSSTGTVHYVNPDFPGSIYDRTDEVTFAPGHIEPGEPLDVHVQMTEKLITTDPCSPMPISDVTLQQDSWFLFRVGPGEQAYGMASNASVFGSGTYRVDQDQVCVGANHALQVVVTTDLAVSGESTALLEPGCYQTTGINPHLVFDPAAVTGTIATLTVGDVSCIDELELTVKGSYSYSGSMAGSAVALNGTDRIEVRGTPEALAQVSRVCMESSWAAKVQIRVPTTLRIAWNGVLALALHETTSISVDPPDKKGLLKSKYGEAITWRRCVSATDWSFPALELGSGLGLLHPSPFLAVTHSVRLFAVLADGREFPVSVAGSSAKPGAVSWAQEATQVFRFRP